MCVKRKIRVIWGLVLLIAFCGYFHVAFTYTLPTAEAESAAPPEAPAPTLPPEPAASPVPTSAPEAEPDAPPEFDLTSWEFLLVDAAHPAGSYAPAALMLEGQPLDIRVIEPMKQMIADARDEGLSVYLSSGYRDYATQNTLFIRSILRRAEDGSFPLAEAPGCSEHQTGLCCDITDIYHEEKTAELADTPTLQWMHAHCAEYGFILRYPEGKENLTGHAYEPWHFRYVGCAAAEYISAHGLCLEEFLELYG